MSFTRHGSNEELEPISFKCPKCGKKSITIIAGQCELCNLKKFKKIKDIKDKHKHAI